MLDRPPAAGVSNSYWEGARRAGLQALGAPKRWGPWRNC